MEQPLVTAIMPTRGRPQFAAAALRMFDQQTYPNRQIFICDDADARSFSETIRRPDVAYALHPERMPIGWKRNLAIQHSEGEIIVHWDDDDWYSADRIEHQVQLLQRSGAEIVGCHEMVFEDCDSKERYHFLGSPLQTLLIGTSLCYWRKTWVERPFDQRSEAEDVRFQAGRTLAASPSDGRFVARMHDGNTVDKREMISNPRWRKVA